MIFKYFLELIIQKNFKNNKNNYNKIIVYNRFQLKKKFLLINKNFNKIYKYSLELIIYSLIMKKKWIFQWEHILNKFLEKPTDEMENYCEKIFMFSKYFYSIWVNKIKNCYYSKYISNICCPPSYFNALNYLKF